MLEVIVFALAGAGIASPATRQELISPDVQLRHQICYELVMAPAYPAKLAECLSFDGAQDARFTAYACDFLRNTDQLADFDFSTYSACTRHLLEK
jgi:hypothetical protein